MGCTPEDGETTDAPTTGESTTGTTDVTTSEGATTEPTTGTTTTTGTETTSGPGCVMAIEDDIVEDLLIPADCVVQVLDHVIIYEDATLTVEPGARLEMAMGAALEVGKQFSTGGRMIAAGTAEAPILITSLSEFPTPGDWGGIQLRSETLSGTQFDHVIIEYGGSEDEGGGIRYRLDSEFVEGRVAVDNSTFRNNVGGGIVMWANTNGADHQEPDMFASFTGNTFTDSDDYSMILHSNAISQIELSNTIDAPILIMESLYTDNAPWPDHGLPYVFRGDFTVMGDDATLSLDGLELRALSDAELIIDRGTLVANEVVFRSGKTTPLPGDWKGIKVGSAGNDVSQAIITGCTISHASGLGGGALEFHADEDALLSTVNGTTFSENVGDADIDAHGECDAFINADPPNVFGLAPCI